MRPRVADAAARAGSVVRPGRAGAQTDRGQRVPYSFVSSIVAQAPFSASSTERARPAFQEHLWPEPPATEEWRRLPPDNQPVPDDPTALPCPARRLCGAVRQQRGRHPVGRKSKPPAEIPAPGLTAKSTSEALVASPRPIDPNSVNDATPRARNSTSCARNIVRNAERDRVGPIMPPF